MRTPGTLQTRSGAVVFSPVLPRRTAPGIGLPPSDVQVVDAYSRAVWHDEIQPIRELNFRGFDLHGSVNVVTDEVLGVPSQCRTYYPDVDLACAVLPRPSDFALEELFDRDRLYAQIAGASLALSMKREAYVCEALARSCGGLVHGPESWAARVVLGRHLCPTSTAWTDAPLLEWSEAHEAKLGRPPTEMHVELCEAALSQIQRGRFPK